MSDSETSMMNPHALRQSIARDQLTAAQEHLAAYDAYVTTDLWPVGPLWLAQERNWYWSLQVVYGGRWNPNPLTWEVDKYWLAESSRGDVRWCVCGHPYDDHDPFRNGLPCLQCAQCVSFSMKEFE